MTMHTGTGERTGVPLYDRVRMFAHRVRDSIHDERFLDDRLDLADDGVINGAIWRAEARVWLDVQGRHGCGGVGHGWNYFLDNEYALL